MGSEVPGQSDLTGHLCRAAVTLVTCPFETKPIAAQAMTRNAMAGARTFHDARLVRNAMQERDDWVARMMLATWEGLRLFRIAVAVVRLRGISVTARSV